MTQTGTKRLDVGNLFPVLEFRLVDGKLLTLPTGLKGKWSVLVLYRGHWWPFCRQQLAHFQGRIGEFNSANIRVVAASVDTVEDAQKTLPRYKLTFPLAFGLDAREVSSITGAFFDEANGFLHAIGFIMDPDGRVACAVYSTGPIGRFTAADCLGMIGYLAKKAG